MLHRLTTVGAVALLVAACQPVAQDAVITDTAAHGLSLSPTQVRLPVGQQVRLTAFEVRDDGTTVELSASALSWNASSAACSVSDGLVRGNSAGSCTVTASRDAATASALVTVSAGTPVSLSIAAPTATLTVGSRAQLQAIVSLADGMTFDATGSTEWTTSAPGVAAITKGLCEGRSPGSALITATFSGAKATFTIAVSPVQLARLETTDQLKLAAGTSGQLDVTGVYQDNTRASVTKQATFESDNPRVATVDAGGQVKAVGEGEATVTVKVAALSRAVKVLVFGEQVTSIVIAASGASSGGEETTVTEGTTLKLTATAILSNGSQKDVTNDSGWVVGDARVAAISAKGVLVAMRAGETEVAVNFRKVVAKVKVKVVGRVLRKLELSAQSVTLGVGLSTKVTVVGRFTDGTAQDVTGLVGWTCDCSNPGMLAVLPGGVLVGAAAGSGDLVVRMGEATAKLRVAVVAPPRLAGLELSQPRLQLAVGASTRLLVFGVFDDGSRIDLTAQASFVSTSGSIVAVGGDGLLLAVAKGSSRIVVTIAGATQGCDVEVVERMLVAVDIAGVSGELSVGETVQLSAIASFSDGRRRDVGQLAVWSSDQPSVATVSASGKLRAAGAGVTTVSAAYGGFTAKAQIPVRSRTLASISIGGTLVVAEGGATQLTALAKFGDGATADVTSAVAWTVSDVATVAVSSNGICQGVKAGSASVTATLQGIVATAAVKVSASPAIGLALGGFDRKLSEAGTLQLHAVATLADGSRTDVTPVAIWATDNPGVARVSASGVLTLVDKGEAELSVTYSGLVAKLRVQVDE